MSASHSGTISLWAKSLASSHLGSLSSPTPLPPPSELATLLALSLADSSTLPLSTVLSLSILCPWESYEPLRELYNKGGYTTIEVEATARSVVGAFVDEVARMPTQSREDTTGSNTPAGALKAVKVLHSFVKLSPATLSSAVVLLSSSTTSPLPVLPSLATLYPALPHLHSALSLLHLASLLVIPPPKGNPTSTPLASLPPALFSETLPPSDASAPPPAPFTSLWADIETLFQLSDTLFHLSHQPSPVDGSSESSHLWGVAAHRLGELEGDKDDFLAVAARREVEEGKEERENRVLASVRMVLPDLREEFVRAAAKHPTFSSAGEGAGEKIVQSVLDGSVPTELVGLMAEPVEEEEDEYIKMARQRREEAERNTGVGSIDFDKLRVGKDSLGSSPLPLSSALQASILRLAQVQEEEALQDEQDRLESERAGVVAYGGETHEQIKYDDRGDASRVGRGVEDDEPLEGGVSYRYTIGGEGSDDEEEPEVTKGGPSIRKDANINTETMLEQAYVYNRKVFDRDAATRRGPERKALREALGLADEQIEGWKTALERNPRKTAALLERHELAPNMNHLVPVEEGRNSHSHRGGRGGGGGGRGGGGGEGGRGGGRGRANKGNRGHANQARVRGHDRKVRMGGAGGA